MRVEMIKRDLLTPDKDQPRKYFDDEKLELLKDNIKLNGILNPLIVKKVDNSYLIIDGERRYKSSGELSELPCIIVESDNVLELQLITSCLKEDLTVDELDNAIYKLYEYYLATSSQKERRGGNEGYREIGRRIGKSKDRVSKAIDRYEFKDRQSDFTKDITEKFNPENKGYSKVNSTISMTGTAELSKKENDEVRKVIIEDILDKKHSSSNLPKENNPVIKEKIKQVEKAIEKVDNIEEKKVIAKNILNNLNVKYGIEKDINELFLEDLNNLRLSFMSNIEKKLYKNHKQSLSAELLKEYQILSYQISSYFEETLFIEE